MGATHPERVPGIVLGTVASPPPTRITSSGSYCRHGLAAQCALNEREAGDSAGSAHQESQLHCATCWPSTYFRAGQAAARGRALYEAAIDDLRPFPITAQCPAGTTARGDWETRSRSLSTATSMAFLQHPAVHPELGHPGLLKADAGRARRRELPGPGPGLESNYLRGLLPGSRRRRRRRMQPAGARGLPDDPALVTEIG